MLYLYSLENCRLQTFELDLFDYDADIGSDEFATFGGLKGRAQPKHDSPIERDLALSLEENFNGAIKKMKISRKVFFSFNALEDSDQ
jgi:hypothetical protein